MTGFLFGLIAIGIGGVIAVIILKIKNK